MANAGNLSPDEILIRYSDLIVKECLSVTYQQFLRSKDGMEGECVKITDEFQQVLSQKEADYIVCLISITYNNYGYFEYYDDPVYFIIPVDVVNTRPIVSDKAVLWGICGGFDTLEMSTGALETLPTLATAKVQFIKIQNISEGSRFRRYFYGYETLTEVCGSKPIAGSYLSSI